MHFELIGFMPNWVIDTLFMWYLRNKISHEELITAMNWLFENTV